MGRLFGADGIRGTIDTHPLAAEDAQRLGQSVAAWLLETTPAPTLLIGTDTRESGQRLKVAFVDGLARAGVRVVDAGILPTAAISYLIASKGIFSGGAVVSASHNPIFENGIKVFDHRGAKIGDDIEAYIEELFFGPGPLPFQIYPAPGRQEPDYGRQYARALADEYRAYEWGARRILLDCANGAAYQLGPAILEDLRLPYVLLNAAPDGTNINRQAGSECVRAEPRRLADELQRYDAEIGVALDGDADRVLFVDRGGRLYDGDMVLAMLAQSYHDAGLLRGETVVITQMSNGGLEDFVRKLGVRTRQVRNGDKYVTNALLEDDLLLGGEAVGHVIVHTDKTRITGDGLRTALLVLGQLANRPGAALPDLAPAMQKWPQVNASAHLGFHTDLPARDIPGLEELIQQIHQQVTGPVRLECRPASTEPVYRVMIEARSADVLTLARHARCLCEHVQRHFGCLGHLIEIVDCVAGGCIHLPGPASLAPRQAAGDG